MLSYDPDLGEIWLKTIAIKNIKDTDPNTSTPIYVGLGENTSFAFDGLSFENIYKEATGGIDDGTGHVYCILGFGDAQPKGHIKNTSFTEVANIDSSGNVIMDDSGGIYIHTTHEGTYDDPANRLQISHITAKNTGRRLIKIDGRNIDIDHVTSKSEYNNQVTAIGVNCPPGYTSGNINIDEVDIEGISNVGIALTGEDFNVSNARINIDKGSGTWEDAFGFMLGGKRITIRKAGTMADPIVSERGVFMLRNDNPQSNAVEDLVVEDSVFEMSSPDSVAAFHLHWLATFKSIRVENVHAIFKSTHPEGRAAFFMAGESGSLAGEDLSILNCSAETVNPNGFGIRLDRVSNVTIDGFEFKDTGNGIPSRSAATLTNCTGGSIANVTTAPPSIPRVSCSGCSGVGGCD